MGSLVFEHEYFIVGGAANQIWVSSNGINWTQISFTSAPTSPSITPAIYKKKTQESEVFIFDVSALTTSAAGKYKNESDFDYMTVKF
jgi:hypothetical protein